MSVSIRKLGTLVALALVIAACSDDTNDGDGGGNGSDTLAPPSNLVAQSTSSTAISVTFSTVTGAVGYVVERAEGAAGAFAVVAEPDALGPALVARFGDIVDRFTFYTPYELDETLLAPAIDVLRSA